jgi:FkbM family methyltransferase
MSVSAILKNLVTPKLDPRLSTRFYQEFNSNPLVVYDIGAAGGVYTPFSGGPSAWAPVVAFEPHPESFRKLQDSLKSGHVSLHRHAISDSDGELDFHAGLGTAKTKSSLLPIDHLGLPATLQKVAGLRLDSVKDVLGHPAANFLKLDTEGTEKSILQGGLSMLDEEVLGIRIEIAFWRDSPQPTAFWEIDKLLTEKGFILFDLQINRSASQLRSFGGRKDKVRSGDALYLKDPDNGLVSARRNGSLRSQLLKLISLSVTWGYLAYALELADHGRKKNIFSQQDFKEMAAPWLATQDIADYLPNFYGRYTLARLFDFLSYTFNPNIKKGVPFPFNGLGNHWIVRRIGHRPSDIELYCPVLKAESQNRRKKIKFSSCSDDQQED